MDTYCCLGRTPLADCSRGLHSWSFNTVPDWLKPSFLCVEVSVDLPQACMTDSVKRLLEVYEVVEQIALVLQVFLYE